jgi:branched-chain amino acid transport system ATP-binding protein
VTINPILSVQGLSATRGKRAVISNVDLEIFPGDRINIQGENGCGKSTFLEALLGLIPSKAERREWLGLAGTPYHHAAFRNGSAVYLPQFHNLFPSLTLRANILIGSSLEERDKASRLRMFCDAFPEIARLLDANPRIVSGGLRQITAVFRALMHRPRLLVLDEPMAGISTAVIPALCDLLLQFDPENSALIYTDHHQAVGKGIANRCFVMVGGALSPQPRVSTET